jgi:hypothetical protein
MIEQSNSRNAGVLSLIGALLALSLAVVVPIHLNHRFLPACNTVRSGLRVAHHTVVDKVACRLEARIDRISRDPAPESANVGLASATARPGALPRASSAPPQNRKLRRLRIAPAHADDGDPFHHIAFLRV